MPANIQGLILPIAFLVIFYFLVIRPQQKREKQVREMREALRVGDKIITIGGIHGKITELQDTTATLELATGLSIKVEKSAISTDFANSSLETQQRK